MKKAKKVTYMLKARSHAKISVFLTSIPLIILLGVFLIISQFSIQVFARAFLDYLILPVACALLFMIPLKLLSRHCRNCLETGETVSLKKIKILYGIFWVGFLFSCIALVLIAQFVWFDTFMLTNFLLIISPLIFSVPLAFSAFAKARSL